MVKNNTDKSSSANAAPSASHGAQRSERDTADIQTLARLAGLERALARFPDDVATAARTALKIRASFQAPDDNTAELWPVMQVKS